jgi:glycosyltransferase involved in cell wall biosynthesis
MNVLFVSSWWPYPPDSGGKSRVFNIIKELSQRHHVTLLSFSRSGPISSPAIRAVEQYCQVEEPVVLSERKSITGKGPRWKSEQMRAKIRSQLGRTSYHVIVAYDLVAGYYVSEVSGLPRVLDNCEISGFTGRRVTEPRAFRRLVYSIDWWNRSRLIRRVLDRFDACTAVSEEERLELGKLVSDPSRIHVVANGVDLEWNAFHDGPVEPYSLIYPGSLTFGANLDAVRYFLDAIFPLVRRRFQTSRLRVTGSYGNVDLSQFPLGPNSGVTLTGYLEDVRNCVAESAVCVIPLRIGGGTRVKILEAMALGVPVVSTTKGAQGLAVTPGKDILIADEPAEFADLVCTLFSDQALRRRLARQARRFVEAFYDWRVCIAPLEDLLEQLTA